MLLIAEPDARRQVFHAIKASHRVAQLRLDPIFLFSLLALLALLALFLLALFLLALCLLLFLFLLVPFLLSSSSAFAPPLAPLAAGRTHVLRAADGGGACEFSVGSSVVQFCPRPVFWRFVCCLGRESVESVGIKWYSELWCLRAIL